jgi:hypothetical protein
VANPTGSFIITPGKGGTSPNNGPTLSGSASIVKQGSTNILVAAGGGTPDYVSRESIHYGGQGGQASACTPTVGAHSGGKGSSAYGLILGLLTGDSGAGGGAGNSEGDGANGTDSETNGGAAGTGSMPAGKGASSVTDLTGDHGKVGGSYGGGGSGASSWASSHNGGAGAPGVVRVTYTYIGEGVTMNDAETTICSEATYDVALDITPIGFTLD